MTDIRFNKPGLSKHNPGLFLLFFIIIKEINIFPAICAGHALAERKKFFFLNMCQERDDLCKGVQQFLVRSCHAVLHIQNLFKLVPIRQSNHFHD